MDTNSLQVKHAIAIGAIAVVFDTVASNLIVFPSEVAKFLLSTLLLATTIAAMFSAVPRKGLVQVAWITFSVPMIATINFSNSTFIFSLPFTILFILVPGLVAELAFLLLKRGLPAHIAATSGTLTSMILLLYIFNPIQSVYPNFFVLISISVVIGGLGGLLGFLIFTRFLSEHFDKLFTSKKENVEEEKKGEQTEDGQEKNDKIEEEKKDEGEDIEKKDAAEKEKENEGEDIENEEAAEKEKKNDKTDKKKNKSKNGKNGKKK